VIVSKDKVRAALDRAQDLGASDIEECCAVAAQALAIPIEAVLEVAYEFAGQDAGGATA
jgi:hypothetical protein